MESDRCRNLEFEISNLSEDIDYLESKVIKLEAEKAQRIESGKEDYQILYTNNQELQKKMVKLEKTNSELLISKGFLELSLNARNREVDDLRLWKVEIGRITSILKNMESTVRSKDVAEKLDQSITDNLLLEIYEIGIILKLRNSGVWLK